MSGRYPLPPVPDGWYRVAASADVAPGEVRPLHSLARDLVLFRDSAGAARLFDAHCPHQGAHLGHGGRVEGERLRCPFHGWLFGPDGRCVAVPRLGRTPPQAGVRAYPVVEMEGCILAWVDAAGAEPSWQVQEIRPGVAAAWTDWATNHYEVRTHVQELGENILDLPHFWNVHDMDVSGDRHFDARFEAHEMIVEQTLKSTPGEAAGVDVVACTTNSGPGLSVTRVAFGRVETLTFITQTPSDVELLDLHLHFSMKRIGDERAEAQIEKMNREFINLQFTQDIPIWENKIYREKPLLTAIDGPVADYRRWFSQFYSELRT